MGAVKELIRESIKAWDADDAPSLSAALAFYTLLSLSPIVIVVVGVAGLAFGKVAASGQLAWEIHDVIGWNAAEAIQSIIHSAERHHAGVIATVLSLLALAVGASSVVLELRSSLNAVWHVPAPANRSGFRAILQMGRDRFYSFGLVTAAGVLLLLSVAVSAWIAALGRIVGPRLLVPEGWLHGVAFVTSYAMITLLFSAIYRLLPDVRLEWRDVIIGASVTSFVFTCGKQLIALYLGKAAFASTYGAAGSFVLLLVWVYYSAQLFFLGAEFTKVYARIHGSHSRTAARRNPSIDSNLEQQPPASGVEIETERLS